MSHAYPGHQPELDLPAVKQSANSWETTSRLDFLDPRIRKRPLIAPKTQASWVVEILNFRWRCNTDFLPLWLDAAFDALRLVSIQLFLKD